jgi:flagellar assembly protein FliH
MTLPKAKIIKAVGGAAPVGPLSPSPGAARVMKARAAEAAVQASEKIAAAEQRARVVLEAAAARARAIEEQARDEGQKAAVAELAVAWVRLRTEQNARDERDLDRTIELARAMAERLVGAELELAPEKIRSIAQQVLAAARQSRRVTLRAHPDDAAALGRDLAVLGLEEAAIEIQADGTRTRGSLLIDTDLGTLDAHLTIQLDRLARSLRDGFRS